jgi:dTDP-glucose 4,6-dehydratase
MAIFVTGGAGFIGSQFVRDWVERYPSNTVINFDKLTYAGNLENLSSVASHPSYRMIRGDICDASEVLRALPQNCEAIVHFAAESHVDRSILSATEFVRTNVAPRDRLCRRNPPDDRLVSHEHHVGQQREER